MIAADLRDPGWRVSKNMVAALMAEMGLAARPKERHKGTTRPTKGRRRPPDLVKRDFPAAAINVKWYGDGTDIDIGEGKLYLDSVLDVGSRRMLGFALGEHHDAELAYRALEVAVRDAIAYLRILLRVCMSRGRGQRFVNASSGNHEHVRSLAIESVCHNFDAQGTGCGLPVITTSAPDATSYGVSSFDHTALVAGQVTERRLDHD